MPLSTPWAHIILSWVPATAPFLYLTQGLMLFSMLLALLPTLWTGIVAAIPGKGGDWQFDIKEGQDLATVHGKEEEK